MTKETNRRDIPNRTFAFAVRIIRAVNALAKTGAAAAIARQLLRSGTSVGANVEEAQAAQTKREFTRRMNIAKSEARETLYWLRLIRESSLLPAARLAPLLNEAEELVRILTVIVRRSQKN